MWSPASLAPPVTESSKREYPMSVTLRHRLSSALLRFGADRALERQQMERSVVAAGPQTPGYQSALAAHSSARMAETVMLWVGWRLQPRAIEPR